MPAGHILALDQGTTSTRAILFARRTLASVAVAQQEFPQHFPASGLGRARPGGHLGDLARGDARGAGQGRARGRATSPASASPTSARRRSSGTARTGAADPPRHRLAGPPHRRPPAPRCARPGMPSRSRAKTGLLLDPYFSGTKIAWLLDNVAGARAGRGARRARLRHRRQLPALAPDRRQGARHRRHQRLAHAALRHPAPAPGTTSCCALLRVPDGHAAGGARLRRRVRQTDRSCSGRRHPDPRHRRRPAGGDRRPGLLRPGMMKSTYGTGCFALLNTGDDAGRLAATGC